MKDIRKSIGSDVLYVIGFSCLSVTLLFFLTMIFWGCTISFQNISSNGKANDLVDEDLTNSPDVKTDMQFPMMQGL
jgi:hypothetical protein